MDSNYVVETKSITKRFKASARTAVESLDLRIEKGTIYGILGPNGAGKTTTLSMLSGLVKPDKGEIVFGARDVGVSGMIGYIPQELALYDKLSGLDNLKFFGRLYGLKGIELKARIQNLLEIIGLESRAGDLVSRYSTGMKRRLNLAAGLVHNPDLILMDEPTVGVDPQSRNRIFEAIEGIKKQGRTVLYTTHYMEEAARLCDRVAVMDNGRLIIEGEPGRLVREKGTYRIVFYAPKFSVDTASSIEALNCDLKVSIEGEFVTVKAPAEKERMDLVNEMSAAFDNIGVAVRLISVTEPNLESLFLDLTGRNVRDEASG